MVCVGVLVECVGGYGDRGDESNNDTDNNKNIKHRHKNKNKEKFCQVFDFHTEKEKPCKIM
jgi:hypothetical protein